MISGLYKKPFPGLGIAAGLFAAYVVVDNIASVGEHSDHHEGPAPTFEKTVVGEMPVRTDGGGEDGHH